MAGGRQREFEKNGALDEAMRVFWKKGFVGASLSDLTSSMGINKPSMYAAFGNKEQLFVQATEHYIENYAKRHIEFLYKEGEALDKRVKAYMMSVVRGQCDPSCPKGCYISLCVSESASESLPEDAVQMIEKARDFSEAFLTQYFQTEIDSGNISAKQNPQQLALFVVTVLHGTAAMARGGKTIESLEPMIDFAVAAMALD